MSFPVIHSTLDPRALAAEAQRRYRLDAPVRCHLVSRGSNDIYAVEHPGGRLALRVARAGFRSAGDTAAELRFVQHLAERSLPVPAPVPAASGELLFAVDAPEGSRQVAAFRWVTGRSRHPLDVDEARRAGESLAALHIAGATFDARDARRFDVLDRIERRRAALDALLERNPADQRDFAAALGRLSAFLGDPRTQALPRGMTHGDFQPANVLFGDPAGPVIIDFDDCGVDFLIKDIACFQWRNRFDGVDPAVDAAFLRGYELRRPLAAAERAALPMFLMARNLYLVATYAEFVDRLGPIPGFDSYVRFTSLFEADLDAQTGKRAS